MNLNFKTFMSFFCSFIFGVVFAMENPEDKQESIEGQFKQLFEINIGVMTLEKLIDSKFENFYAIKNYLHTHLALLDSVYKSVVIGKTDIFNYNNQLDWINKIRTNLTTFFEDIKAEFDPYLNDQKIKGKVIGNIENSFNAVKSLTNKILKNFDNKCKNLKEFSGM